MLVSYMTRNRMDQIQTADMLCLISSKLNILAFSKGKWLAIVILENIKHGEHVGKVKGERNKDGWCNICYCLIFDFSNLAK